MRHLQRVRLKSSRNKTVAENANRPQRQPRVGQTADDRGLNLAAEPTYDREYNHLLTLEEAVLR